MIFATQITFDLFSSSSFVFRLFIILLLPLLLLILLLLLSCFFSVLLVTPLQSVGGRTFIWGVQIPNGFHGSQNVSKDKAMSEQVRFKRGCVLDPSLFSPFKLHSFFYELGFIVSTCLQVKDADESLTPGHVLDGVVEKAYPGVQSSQ